MYTCIYVYTQVDIAWLRSATWLSDVTGLHGFHFNHPNPTGLLLSPMNLCLTLGQQS